jgi:hypothetical protein
MKMFTGFLRLLCIAIALASTTTYAHKASDSYLVLNVKGDQVSGQWDIALRDIDFAIGLDANGDADITWGEVRARHADIAAWALGRLTVSRGGTDAANPCSLQVAEHLIDTHTDGAYAVLRLTGTCPDSSGALKVNYRLLFDIDQLHRGLLRLDLDGVAHSSVLGPQSGVLELHAGESSRLRQLGRYLLEGIWHIWIGFDHILFLLSLLLPAVLVHQSRSWTGVPSFKVAATEVLWVVTAFTIAHSITLSLAALQIIELPSRLVESCIAASVVLAAANNIWPVVEHRRWMVAFSFGLIHGFGFASVLTELGLPRDALVLSLLGFNLGVETGQLAIVAVFLPVAYLIRNTPLYRKGVFIGGSLLTMLVALIWLAERLFNLKLISA